LKGKKGSEKGDRPDWGSFRLQLTERTGISSVVGVVWGLEILVSYENSIFKKSLPHTLRTLSHVCLGDIWALPGGVFFPL
jgi:hypothetical protein